MKYIAYALPPGTRRYAFVGVDEIGSVDDLAKFNGLGIRPICYSKANYHEALTVALEEWADNAESNWLDQTNRIKSILSTIENVTPPQEDVLHFYLSTSDGLERFCSVCTELSTDNQLAVLRWLRRTDLLKPIFDSRALRKPDLNLLPLVQWLGTLFLSNSKTVAEFWSVVADFGTRLSETLFDQLEASAYRAIQSNPRDADLVLTFLHTSVPGITCALPNSRFAPEYIREREVSVPELKRLLTVRMEPSKLYVREHSSKQRFRLRWNSATRDIRAAISNTTSIDIDSKLEILEQALIEAHLLDRKFNEGWKYDPLGDWFPDLRRVELTSSNPVSAIIVTMVEAINSGDISAERCQKWSRHEIPLLRSMAILAIGLDAYLESGEKIRWLLEHGDNVLEVGVRNEAMQLLTDNISEVDDKLRHEVFSRICSDSGYPLDTYRALSIVTESKPDWTEAIDELKRLETDDDEVRDTLRRQAEWAQDGDCFESSATLELDGLEGYLIQFDRGDERHVKERIAAEVSDYAECFPYGAVKLASTALEQTHPVAETVVKEAISHIRAEDILRSPKEFLNLCGSINPDQALNLAFVLMEATGNEIDGDDSTILERSIRRLWQKGLHRDESAPKTQTSEIWREVLAVGVIRLAYSKWQRHEDAKLAARWLEDWFEWLMLSPEARSPVIKAFTSRLGFLFSLNEAFTTNKILPCFDDSSLKDSAWAGFLKSPGLTRRDPARSQIKKLLEQGWEQVDERELRGIFREVVLFAIENRLMPAVRL